MNLNSHDTAMEADRYVELPGYIAETQAWIRLSGTAVKAWLAINMIYDGTNNGAIVATSRDIGRRMGFSHVWAAKAISELIDAGFLRRTNDTGFGRKRMASEYRLTHLRDDITGQPASEEFMVSS